MTILYKLIIAMTYMSIYRKNNGSPFLEVHLIKQLAIGGFETVANAKVLCPNCHRKAYCGKEKT